MLNRGGRGGGDGGVDCGSGAPSVESDSNSNVDRATRQTGKSWYDTSLENGAGTARFGLFRPAPTLGTGDAKSHLPPGWLPYLMPKQDVKNLEPARLNLNNLTFDC